MPHMENALDWPLRRILPLIQQRIMEGAAYHGIPTLKSPLDFWTYQEILWETRPDVIVEIGAYRGGSALALAHACDALGTGRVISVDVDQARIDPRARAHPRAAFVSGDACQVFPQIQRMLEGAKGVMIIEDSAHTFDNTLRVLQTYSPLVGAGHYFIVEDGICHHGLDIGPQPGPFEAVESFIASNSGFVIDRSREGYCVTWNPKGYLKRVGS